MRIDAYNQVNQVLNTQKLAKSKKAYEQQQVSMGRDQLQISQAGQDYQIAKQAVAETSDIREDKVGKLKEMIANNSYHVDPEDFASKLLEKFNAIN